MHKLLAWWQLLRIGNVFTAVSNVIAGFLIAQGGWQPVGPLFALIAASALLYAAGMVLNDAFDAELDAVERPERPIPSGRISRGTAAAVGWTLLFVGVLCACFASFLLGDPRPGAVGIVLALCIVGYDVGLKSTPLGPWIMGTCRLLNVMLGACTATELSILVGSSCYANSVGVYTVGLTYYARSENGDRRTANDRIGLFFVTIAIFSLLFIPHKTIPREDTILTLVCWWVLLLFIPFDWVWLSKRQVALVVIRRRVSRMICGFIMMDSLVIYMVVGWIPALMVLCLLIPTWIASRFAPMT